MFHYPKQIYDCFDSNYFFDSWRVSVLYISYTSNTFCVCYNFLHIFLQQLYFWTSSPAMPASAEGFQPMPSVTVKPANDHQLPTANTCISRLYLPIYSSKTILRNKLLMAIKTKVFGFVWSASLVALLSPFFSVICVFITQHLFLFMKAIWHRKRWLTLFGIYMYNMYNDIETFWTETFLVALSILNDFITVQGSN